MSYYQKYRPRKVSELNLLNVRDSFSALLKSGKVSHAYLFVGPRGSGKTSAARILSQIVNCEKNSELNANLLEPCGECVACKTLLNGSGVDVIEIDAASNGLVEDIRDLRDKVRLSPVQMKKKVYIIDEVHMVSTAGFNALLKTLEEPPPHAMFILCTTEGHKVPDTIISRCSKINFYRASEDELVDSLRKVVAAENLKVTETALLLLSQMADGSFREGHKLLEQLAGFESEVTDELIMEKLGGSSNALIKMAVESSLSYDSIKVLEVFDELERFGAKSQVVLSSLISYLKSQLEISLKSKANVKDILKMIELLISASEQVKYSPDPLLPIEMALLEVSLSGEGSGGTNRAATVIKPLKVEDEKVDVVDKVMTEQIKREINASLEKIKDEWADFLDSFAESNGSLAGMLRNSSPTDLQGKSLVLSVRSRFQRDMLERDVKKKVIEEEMGKVWGPINLKTILQEQPMRTTPSAEDANVVVSSVDVEKIFGG